jgi:CRISPR-associated protein (TIGR02584 family)
MAEANLLFVAGASPQIVTETVYCLLSEPLVTTDIHVLTTTTGGEVLRQQLLGPPAQWRQFVRAYPRARRFRLAASNIIVLRDARGHPLADVRSRSDNVVAADQIAGFVAEHTRNGAPPLHASIAGGRKTMGYMLAAAMMLHGRREDRLSHVLVRPPELEGTNFYFPPRSSAKRQLSFQRPDGQTVKVSGGDIHIDLADLPFVRLRAVRNPEVARQISFSDLVEQCQADLDALAQPRLAVFPGAGVLQCSGRTVRLPPVRFTIYELLAERRRDGCRRPVCPGCAKCLVPAAELRAAFRARLRERLDARGSAAVGVGRREWSEQNFRAERTKINAVLLKALRAASAPYTIAVVGERGERMYGLTLAPDLITVQE